MNWAVISLDIVNCLQENWDPICMWHLCEEMPHDLGTWDVIILAQNRSLEVYNRPNSWPHSQEAGEASSQVQPMGPVVAEKPGIRQSQSSQ